MIRRALVLVLAACGTLIACGGGGGGGGGGTPTQPTPPAPDVITVGLDEFSYSPRQLTIEPGETVRWVLMGSDPSHTVTARDGAFDSGLAFQDAGDSFQRTFSTSEAGQTFEYSCASHSDCCDMKGSIRVGASAPAPDPGY